MTTSETVKKLAGDDRRLYAWLALAVTALSSFAGMLKVASATEVRIAVMEAALDTGSKHTARVERELDAAWADLQEHHDQIASNRAVLTAHSQLSPRKGHNRSPR